MMKLHRWALLWLIGLLMAVTVVEVIFPFAAFEPQVDQMLQGPGWNHVLGTDSLGRDLFARLLIGAKVSLGVGLCGSVLAFSIGLFWGGFCGWYSGWRDKLGMRLVDLLSSVPGFALVSVVTLTCLKLLPMEESFAKSALAVTLGIGLTRWMNVARVVRGLVLSMKTRPYIEASRALGLSDFQIYWNHLLPNMRGPLVALFGLQVPSNILYESFMSFIGLGVHSPQTSWGLLIQDGWRSLSSYPHLILAPSAALFLTVWSLSLIFEGRLRGSPSSKGGF